MSLGDRLRAHGFSPKKRFGQNFLTDVHASKAIAEAATTPAGGTVLEIGPGLGALTRHLVERAAKVVAVEYDSEIIPLLTEELPEPLADGRLRIIEGDALDLDWLAPIKDGPRPHGIAGNLPYLITGRLIERADTIEVRSLNLLHEPRQIGAALRCTRQDCRNERPFAAVSLALADAGQRQ